MPGWGEGRDRGRAECLKGGEQPPQEGMLQYSGLAFAALFTGLGSNFWPRGDLPFLTLFLPPTPPRI